MDTHNEVILPKEKEIIFFDGVCNLCNGFVNYIIDRDTQKQFVFASLQSEQSKNILQNYDFDPSRLSSVALLQSNGELLVKSDAALKILTKLGGGLKWLSVFYIFPSFMRNLFYDIIARYRYKWFGRKDQCRIPTPELKQRFLDAY
ncbi:thiol-disulfide oxidoreductase DCC family protein [Fulvivirga sediminis]|uniref:Thiol-disulfide oxidoreductase DCC family protein n=1 Tax=Fulvivirga sediminis TaxID=2803949 RepID=A0A937K0J6_9BACT|nr:thiol-disulfide oxidoreductase DCC family protein [Fulvivirga sediminis]MBL3656396.1 thiol-disulfide oxidoreductase DCC family protein [Fulvivirga sediminis]